MCMKPSNIEVRKHQALKARVLNFTSESAFQVIICLQSQGETMTRYVIVLILITLPLLCACDSEEVTDEGDVDDGGIKSLEVRMAIFDDIWQKFADDYAGFSARDVDWNKVREKYRKEIEKVDDKAGFYAILSRIFSELQDGHARISFRSLCDNDESDSNDYFVLDDWYSRIGVCVTPLDNSRLLVYRADDDNPAQLQTGDMILGYDGRPWALLLEDIEKMNIPVCGMHASADPAEQYLKLGSVVNNSHLFSQMDVLRIGSTMPESIETAKLVSNGPLMLCPDQLVLEDVYFPWTNVEEEKYWSDISWGILSSHNIGYIYVYSWNKKAAEEFTVAVEELLETDALIIDQRFNMGGEVTKTEGLSFLFGSDVDDIMTCVHRKSQSDYETLTTSGGHSYSIEDTEPIEYMKPIAVLTGHKAASSGDIFPYFMKHHPHARTFGRLTEGSFGEVTEFWNPDPYINDISVSYTECVMLDKDHVVLQGSVQNPNEEVWLTQEDVINGIDTVVEAAIKWINEELGR